jgi:hypothetical protein
MEITTTTDKRTARNASEFDKALNIPDYAFGAVAYEENKAPAAATLANYTVNQHALSPRAPYTILNPLPVYIGSQTQIDAWYARQKTELFNNFMYYCLKGHTFAVGNKNVIEKTALAAGNNKLPMHKVPHDVMFACWDVISDVLNLPFTIPGHQTRAKVIASAALYKEDTYSFLIRCAKISRMKKEAYKPSEEKRKGGVRMPEEVKAFMEKCDASSSGPRAANFFGHLFVLHTTELKPIGGAVVSLMAWNK